ncbi:hypothetical protein ScPMuIL_017983 [Solemya velum]
MASQEGIRPIHDAVENDHIELTRMLLSYGADPKLSYAGCSLVKLASTDDMRQLIQGYMSDLNGAEDVFEPWEFYDSYSQTDHEGTTCSGVFEDIPSDPDDDSEELLSDTRLTPVFTTFNLMLGDSLLPENFLVLADLLKFLKISKVYFDRKTAGRHIVRTTSRDRLCAALPGQVCRLSYNSIENDVTVLKSSDLPYVLSMFKNQWNKVVKKSDKHKFCSRKNSDSVDSRDNGVVTVLGEHGVVHSVKSQILTSGGYERSKQSGYSHGLSGSTSPRARENLDFSLKEGTVPEDCFSPMFLDSQTNGEEGGCLPYRDPKSSPEKSYARRSSTNGEDGGCLPYRSANSSPEKSYARRSSTNGEDGGCLTHRNANSSPKKSYARRSSTNGEDGGCLPYRSANSSPEKSYARRSSTSGEEGEFLPYRSANSSPEKSYARRSSTNGEDGGCLTHRNANSSPKKSYARRSSTNGEEGECLTYRDPKSSPKKSYARRSSTNGEEGECLTYRDPKSSPKKPYARRSSTNGDEGSITYRNAKSPQEKSYAIRTSANAEGGRNLTYWDPKPSPEKSYARSSSLQFTQSELVHHLVPR